MVPLSAWKIALLLFVVCVGVICIQRDYFTGKTRLMVRDLIPDPENQAGLKDLRLDNEQRVLPVDWIVRIESLASMEAALRRLGWDGSGEEIKRLSARVFARVVPGSTAIEVIVHGNTEAEVLELLQAIIETQQEIWVAPQRASTESLLNDLEAREARLRGELAKQANILRDKVEDTPTELTAKLNRMEALLMHLEIERDKILAEAVSIEIDGQEQLPPNLPDSDKLEFERLKEGVAQAKAELVQLNSTYGPNNDRVKEKQAQLTAANDAIKICLEVIHSKLERTLRATEAASDGLRTRIRSLRNELRAAGETQNSADVVVATLQLDLIKEQISSVSQQRNKMITFQNSLSAPLIVLSPPRLMADFSLRMKFVQMASAFFGAVLLGFSISAILDLKQHQ